MANRYRVASAPRGWPETLPFRLGVPGHEADYGVGEEFEHEFESHDIEQANLDSGLLEIVPSKYRVIGGSPVHGVSKDDDPPIFEAALTMGSSAALIAGGHIERVADTPAEPAHKRTPRKPKEA